MADNMLNAAKKAKDRALKVLSETEPYISGVNEEGKKILYRLIEQAIEQLKDALREMNRAIGEMDNILRQYGDTPNKDEMLKLRSMLEERERILSSKLDEKK